MIKITGGTCSDLCDPHLKMTRRDLLRVGGAGILGLSLGSLLKLQAVAGETSKRAGGPGWGTAKNVVMIYLQGGPSHLDLWDPKENLPDNIRSSFKPIPTKIPGINFTEVLPELAKVNDKFTMIRSMSYTPNGLFNHTAAIYQIMTGYTTDKVSPSGQLEPPDPKDFPNFGSQIVRLRPLTEPMLPFVMLPRPLQESNVVGQGGSAGFLGKAFDLAQEPDKMRDRYGRNTFGQSCLLARRLIEAGTRVVEVIWPKVANSDNHSWDHHSDLTKRMRDQSGPMLDRGLAAFIADMDDRGLLKDTLVVAIGEFGRSPQKGVSTSGNQNSADGRDHWPYCYTSIVAAG